MNWIQSWRRHASRLFLWLLGATVLINLVQLSWQRDYDLATLKSRLGQLRELVGELPTPIVDLEWEQRLRSWASDRSLRVACLRSDGSVRVESHPAQSLLPWLRSMNWEKITDQDVIVLSPKSSGGDRPLAIALQRVFATESPVAKDDASRASIGFLCVAMGNPPRPTLQQLLPVWWAAAGTFILAAGLIAVYLRRSEQTMQRFAQAAREFSAGHLQELPVVLTRDPEWESLSQAFAEMETNLQEREKLMQEDRLRVQAVLTSMVEGVLAIDADQRIMVVNQSAMTMLSLHGDSVVGRYAGEVVRIPSFENALNEALRSGREWQTEFETVGPRRRTLSIRVTPITTKNSTELAVVLYDITDLRRLETVRRDFVANVSHELKTPLAAIKAYAETLRMGAIDDKENNRRFLEQIETHADLLDCQIRDLMHLARVESGRTAFEMTVVNLDQACLDCIRQFQDEAERREVRLSFTENPHPISARGDREAIHTILDNLVSNAIRYTRPGGWVRIATTVEGGFAALSVADNGIGIAPEHQSRIFERFYRVDKARSRDVGGTGLGLAIVKHTVQALGGQIELTSSIGRGSTFKILLPLQGL